MTLHEQIEAIVARAPRPNSTLIKAGTKCGLRNINHETRIIDYKANWPRECRHANEYGERGEQMEQLMNEWDNEFYNTVEKPCNELGYTIDICG